MSSPARRGGAPPIRIGVVGCGEIAQIMHLPYLSALPEFDLGAVSDPSPTLRGHATRRYSVAGTYSDYRQLLADPTVEAVAVLCHEHSGVVRAALESGRHVLVEKPLCYSARQAHELASLAERQGVVLMVGYMKLFDPVVDAARIKVGQMDRLDSVHVHNFTGDFTWHRRLYDTVWAPPAERSTSAGSSRAVTQRELERLLPDLSPLGRAVFLSVLMSGCHDLALLRAFHGTVAVESVRLAAETGVIAQLTLAGHIPCVFEVNPDTAYAWWDEWLAFYGRQESVRIRFSNPYLRNAATELRDMTEVDGRAVERYGPWHHAEPFRRQWQAFARCVREGEQVISDAAGAARDIAVVEEMARQVVTTVAL